MKNDEEQSFAYDFDKVHIQKKKIKIERKTSNWDSLGNRNMTFSNTCSFTLYWHHWTKCTNHFVIERIFIQCNHIYSHCSIVILIIQKISNILHSVFFIQTYDNGYWVVPLQHQTLYLISFNRLAFSFRNQFFLERVRKLFEWAKNIAWIVLSQRTINEWFWWVCV